MEEHATLADPAGGEHQAIRPSSDQRDGSSASGGVEAVKNAPSTGIREPRHAEEEKSEHGGGARAVHGTSSDPASVSGAVRAGGGGGRGRESLIGVVIPKRIKAAVSKPARSVGSDDDTPNEGADFDDKHDPDYVDAGEEDVDEYGDVQVAGEDNEGPPARPSRRGAANRTKKTGAPAANKKTPVAAATSGKSTTKPSSAATGRSSKARGKARASREKEGQVNEELGDEHVNETVTDQRKTKRELMRVEFTEPTGVVYEFVDTQSFTIDHDSTWNWCARGTPALADPTPFDLPVASTLEMTANPECLPVEGTEQDKRTIEPAQAEALGNEFTPINIVTDILVQFYTMFLLYVTHARAHPDNRLPEAQWVYALWEGFFNGVCNTSATPIIGVALAQFPYHRNGFNAAAHPKLTTEGKAPWMIISGLHRAYARILHALTNKNLAVGATWHVFIIPNWVWRLVHPHTQLRLIQHFNIIGETLAENKSNLDMSNLSWLIGGRSNAIPPMIEWTNYDCEPIMKGIASNERGLMDKPLAWLLRFPPNLFLFRTIIRNNVLFRTFGWDAGDPDVRKIVQALGDASMIPNTLYLVLTAALQQGESLRDDYIRSKKVKHVGVSLEPLDEQRLAEEYKKQLHLLQLSSWKRVMPEDILRFSSVPLNDFRTMLAQNIVTKEGAMFDSAVFSPEFIGHKEWENQFREMRRLQVFLCTLLVGFEETKEVIATTITSWAVIRVRYQGPNGVKYTKTTEDLLAESLNITIEELLAYIMEAYTALVQTVGPKTAGRGSKRSPFPVSHKHLASLWNNKEQVNVIDYFVKQLSLLVDLHHLFVKWGFKPGQQFKLGKEQNRPDWAMPQHTPEEQQAAVIHQQGVDSRAEHIEKLQEEAAEASKAAKKEKGNIQSRLNRLKERAREMDSASEEVHTKIINEAGRLGNAEAAAKLAEERRNKDIERANAELDEFKRQSQLNLSSDQVQQFLSLQRNLQLAQRESFAAEGQIDEQDNVVIQTHHPHLPEEHRLFGIQLRRYEGANIPFFDGLRAAWADEQSQSLLLNATDQDWNHFLGYLERRMPKKRTRDASASQAGPSSSQVPLAILPTIRQGDNDEDILMEPAASPEDVQKSPPRKRQRKNTSSQKKVASQHRSKSVIGTDTDEAADREDPESEEGVDE